MKEKIVGENEDINMLFRFIPSDRKVSINEYSILSLGREYKEFSTDEEILYFTKDININYSDSDFLREYSGYNYKHINGALRGTWNYEENGDVSLKDGYLKTGRKLTNIISKNAISMGNFKTFRGVDISYFKDYGISNLNELKALEGKFLYDKGFVSTSLLKEKCFFKKENEIGLNYNIQITYLIPEEFEDGLYLEGDNTYCQNQKEYLINTSNLARISSVNINNDGTASIVAIMIPKKIYDPYYENLEKEKNL